MSQINPFTGAIALPPTLSLGERLRRIKADAKNLPADEAGDHVVEDPDAIVSISEEAGYQSRDQREQASGSPKKTEDDEDEIARLDITA